MRSVLSVIFAILALAALAAVAYVAVTKFLAKKRACEEFEKYIECDCCYGDDDETEETAGTEPAE